MFHLAHLMRGSAISGKRRCGFTMRFMPATTRLIRDGEMAGWFKDYPLCLVYGTDTARVNTYANA